MTVDLSNEERDFLMEVFEEKQKHMIQEINHTDTIDYERMLKKKLELLEGVMSRMAQ